MNNLQQLLDEKWPMPDSVPPMENHRRFELRLAFSDGYNAAINEIGKFGAKKENQSLTPFSFLTKFVNQD